MKAPDILIAELMQRVRRDLYKGRPDKAWFQQQDTVKKALTFPAAWLEERKVPLSSERYLQILNGIINLMLAKGNLAAVKYPSAYLLDVIQKHMAHHGDTYYQEGKSCRNRVTLDMAVIEKAVAARRASALPDRTVEVLSGVHATLALGKRKSTIKAAATPAQPDLFNGSHQQKG